MLREFVDNVKNVPGWRTNRKMIIFAVDDYGNVRLNSKEARERMDQNGLTIYSRFDAFDTLETRTDLEALFDVLKSVKDMNGRSAIFTPYALSCNIDYDKTQEAGFERIHLELLPDTFSKLTMLDPKSYSGAWELWQEGITSNIMSPQFHGREHFSLKLINQKLMNRDHDILCNLKNRSLTSIDSTSYPGMGWTAAFSFWDPVHDTAPFPEIISEGLKAFKEVYRKNAVAFTAPAQQFPEMLKLYLVSSGIKALDVPFYQAKHLGYGEYKRMFSSMGLKHNPSHVELVRNAVFEPTHTTQDHVGKALRQIETAFRWNKPALISSHRVNFCGHIDEENRKLGLSSLQTLLKAVVKKWSDVEFMSVEELITEIQGHD
jgi:hypothetical protein